MKCRVLRSNQVKDKEWKLYRIRGPLKYFRVLGLRSHLLGPRSRDPLEYFGVPCLIIILYHYHVLTQRTHNYDNEYYNEKVVTYSVNFFFFLLVGLFNPNHYKYIIVLLYFIRLFIYIIYGNDVMKVYIANCNYLVFFL